MKGRLAAWACLALAAVGCSDITDPPPANTPFVYLLLAPTPVTNLVVAADSTPWAVVATLQTLVDARYRATTRFHTRRERDGATFIWQGSELAGPLPGGYDQLVVASGANANVTLAAAGDSGGLGWRALTGGDVYTLDAIAEGSEIQGRTVIPAQPMLEITDAGAGHIVRWQPAAGAAGYYVAASDWGVGRFTTDTAVVWCESPYDPPETPRYVRVVALDANAYRYLGDTTVVAAGLDGALGMFGGANEARIEPATPRPTTPDPGCAGLDAAGSSAPNASRSGLSSVRRAAGSSRSTGRASS